MDFDAIILYAHLFMSNLRENTSSRIPSTSETDTSEVENRYEMFPRDW